MAVLEIWKRIPINIKYAMLFVLIGMLLMGWAFHDALQGNRLVPADNDIKLGIMFFIAGWLAAGFAILVRVIPDAPE